ncbi:MAG: N-acetyltransferase family protein [Pseudomonadota bacterium]
MIRPAREEDLPAIGRIWNAVIRDTTATFTSQEKTDADLVALLEERRAAGGAFLVFDAGEVSGFATYGPFRGGIGYAHTQEHTLYLDPVAQGRGQGGELLSALETQARSQGVHSLVGGISGENEGAIRFHERLGYTRVATLPQVGRKFGRYLDLVLMQKFLT